MDRAFGLQSLFSSRAPLRASTRILGLCALLATACGDDGKGGEVVDSSVDPATGAGDAGAHEGGAPEVPVDQGSLDAGPGDGGVHATPHTDGGATSKPPSGTLLNVPYNGEALSICYADTDCKGGDLGCYAAFGTVAGFCSAKCSKDDDCKPIGGLAATCSPESLCRVDCSGKDGRGGGACPANMECRDFFDPSVVVVGEASEPGFVSIWRCGYPVHAGRNNVQLYQPCDLHHGSGDCEGELLCHVPSSTLNPPTNPGYCAEACNAKADCSVPAGATSVGVCEKNVCELDCAAPGATCPSGMNCRQVGGPISEVRQRCRFIEGKTP